MLICFFIRDILHIFLTLVFDLWKMITCVVHTFASLYVIMRPMQNLLVPAVIFAVTVIIFVHKFLFPLYLQNPAMKMMKHVRDYERFFCISSVAPRGQAYEEHECVPNGIVTAKQGGRLGNQMWEYASVYAVAKASGLKPYVPFCIYTELEQLFSGLTVPTLTHISDCLVDWQHMSYDKATFVNGSILLPRFVLIPELVLKWLGHIRREFSFRQALVNRTQQILRSVTRGRKNNTFVGVHVRRMDYKAYLWRKNHMLLADVAYFHKAMEHFQKKYENVLFLVVSDDPQWCRETLQHMRDNVFVVGQGSALHAGEDLAIMSLCNHSIIDYGTFGMWGALLAGGETVVYNVSNHATVRLAELLPNWHIFPLNQSLKHDRVT